MSEKLPEFLRSVLWSYDLSSLDKERDWRLIISQSLNYGNSEVIEWVKANYGGDKIKEIVVHPRRGIWLREKLRKWLGYFGIMIDPLEFEIAIMEMGPKPKLMNAFWSRKGLV
jgi:hypothetical protein